MWWPGAAGRRVCRFDDRVAATAILVEAEHELIARAPQQVTEVLAQVERATEEGWWAFGYLAYEAASGLDPTLPVLSTPVKSPAEGALPLVWFGLCRRPQHGGAMLPPIEPEPGYSVGRWHPTWSSAAYAAVFAQVKGAIAAGDTYQCNLTTAAYARLSGDPRKFYLDLLRAQSSRYAAYLDLGDHVIASVSPELFFDWHGERLRARPMKGTAARGRTEPEDRRQLAGLLGSAKERAENIIIVDLLRNDLSRIAKTGTVAVPALLTPEQYETVWQLTSDVTATVERDVGLVDVFGALFPCGSVTGAPKMATMALIRRLEARRRGVYCGVIGILGPRGAPCRARFSVAIRTVRFDRRSGQCEYGVGSGITWDSDPDAEYAELLDKMSVLPRPPSEAEEQVVAAAHHRRAAATRRPVPRVTCLE